MIVIVNVPGVKQRSLPLHWYWIGLCLSLTIILFAGTKSSTKFFPVPHAVPSLLNDISSRTILARMKV